MPNLCKIITDTYEIKDKQKIYDFNKCLDFIEYHGKLLYGQTFKICEEDKHTIYKLIIYMIKDKETALKQQINLSKAIAVALGWLLVFRCANSNEISAMVRCRFSCVDLFKRYCIREDAERPAPMIRIFLIICL